MILKVGEIKKENMVLTYILSILGIKIILLSRAFKITFLVSVAYNFVVCKS